MALILNSNTGNITAGGDNSDGDLILNANDGTRRIHLDAGGGNAFLGGNGADGDLALMPSSATSQSASSSTIHLDGDGGNIRAGGNGTDGDLILQSTNGVNVVHIDGGAGNIFAGGDGADGDLVLRDGAGSDRIRLDAGSGNVWIGGNGADGDIVVFAATGDNVTASQATIHLNGDSGDIILRNADCAEEFTVAHSVEAEPGMVMVLGDDGLIRPCTRAFDGRAVGVVSGAGKYKPGIVLDKQDGEADRRPIALVGKVCVRVTDENGPIRVGDLLTTSSLRGHAMKAGTPEQSFGAVIGKALAPHDRGTGLLPMVISLQ